MSVDENARISRCDSTQETAAGPPRQPPLFRRLIEQ